MRASVKFKSSGTVVRNFCGKNFDEIVILKLWQIQGLPPFLMRNSSELR